MDLEAIWHAHKPFILKLIAGAVVFLGLMSARGSLEDSAARLASANASAQATLVDKAAQLEDAEGLEKGRAAALGERLEPALTRALLWRADSQFVLPEGEASPALFYASALSKAVGEVQRHAARWNARVPRGAAGLGLPEEVTDAAVPEALARADLARRVVSALLDAGVREVAAVDPQEARYEARQGDERSLRVLPLRVSFTAGPRQLDAALAAFQVEGAFLEVDRCELLRAEGPGGSLQVELSLLALDIVAQAPSEAVRGPARQASGASGGGRLRRFGRER